MTDKTDREIMQQALEVLVQHVKHYDYEQFTSVCELEPAKDLILVLCERLAQPEQEPVLQDIEQYRMQMASISTAAIGYWKEGDGIHPDYDTPALRDVAMLYAKYDALYKAQQDPLQRFTDVQQEIEAALAPEQKPVDIGTEWTPCVKLPVTVHVRQQRPGETHVSTREGITPVKPDDLIMRGVSGEEYPIGREIFERTYHLGEAHTKPEKEPVAVGIVCATLLPPKDGDHGRYFSWLINPKDIPLGARLYTAPPQRKPLTDEEKLIDLLEAARETFKKSPSDSECSQNAAYVHSVLETMLIKREWQGLFFDAVYEAWHSAGMDVLGGDWNTFASKLEEKLKGKNT